MGNKVFANTREIACKAAAGKTICAFPDVCFTPPDKVPPTPPGVPIPYPNTGMASDTAKGSKKVVISGKEIILKNKSYFKKSMGDEAGCAQKKGIITSKNTGKIYFQAWSMDVKIEGKNSARHLDMTTNNHASMPGDTPPWPYLDRMALMNSVDDCKDDKKKIDEKCGKPLDKEKTKCPDPSAMLAAKANHKAAVDMPRKTAAQKRLRDKAKKAAWPAVKSAQETYAIDINENECANALKCALVTFTKGSAGECCPHSTPDHLVPASQFGSYRGKNHANYQASQAPCMCATGGAQTATHGLLGRGRTEYMIKNDIPVNNYKKSWTVEQSCECGAESAAKVSSCSKKCLQAQLEQGHKDMGVNLQERVNTRKESVNDTEQLKSFREKLGPPASATTIT